MRPRVCHDNSMTSRSLLSDGLPPRLVQQITPAFHALDCTEPALQALVDILGALAMTHDLPDPSAIQRVFLLLVAANHSCSRLSGPGLPFATNPTESLPSTTEWLLLAARERAIASLPPALGATVDALIAQLDAVSTTNVLEAASPLVDYGFGSLLAALTRQTHESPTFFVGQALGKLTRLTLEVVLAARPSSPFLTPVLLRSIAALDNEGQSRLALALAMACQPVPDKLPLVSFLGQSIVRTRIIDACGAWSETAKGAFDNAYRDNLALLLRATNDVITQKTNSLRLLGFAKAPSLEQELDRSIAMAVEALVDDPELRESWDVQRWGGFFETPCKARLFPMGLCALALSAASVDIRQRVRDVLAFRRVDGFAYFEDFPKIPPDADDLGLALQLAASLPPDPKLAQSLEWPVELFVRNVGADGSIPVWLERDLREAISGDAPRWLGSRCLAAAANAVVGLVEANIRLAPQFLDRVVGWLFSTWQAEGMRAVFFYGLPYTRFILLRLAEIVAPKLEIDSVKNVTTLVRDDLRAAIMAARRDDGSIGGILASACHLAGMTCGRDQRFDPWPTLSYLMTRQRPDGFWPSEPLYLTLGKDNTVAAHEARSLTTALCLYALARARKNLRD